MGSMYVIQLSIFVRNRPGELVKITNILAENNIQLRALTVAETADFGILRVIVNEPEKAAKVLGEKEILVGKTEIMAVEMVDKPGTLNTIAKILGDANVNIEYLYAFAKTKENAILLIQVTPDHRERALEAMKANNIKVFTPEEVYNM
jgi:hypothetical protein